MSGSKALLKMSTACEQLVNPCQQDRTTGGKIRVFQSRSFSFTGFPQGQKCVERPLEARGTNFSLLVHTNKKKRISKKLFLLY